MSNFLPILLKGRHVRLEPLSRAHVQGLRAITQGPRDTFGLAFVPLPEQVEAYVDRALAAMDAGQAVVFATCTERGVAGCTRLFDLQRWEWPAGKDPRPEHEGFDAAEIGYTWLAPWAQRTPANTEAKLLMLRHAFEEWGCYRVTLKTDERNERSRNAILRLGAHFDGVLRAFQPAADGTPRNTAYYTILAAEWPAVRDGLVRRLTD